MKGKKAGKIAILMAATAALVATIVKDKKNKEQSEK